MASLVRRILDGCQYVLAFQKVVVRENLVYGSPRAQKLEDVSNTNAVAASAWTSAALTFLDRDTTKTLGGHGFGASIPALGAVSALPAMKFRR